MTVGTPENRHPGLATAIVGLCFSLISWVFNALLLASAVGILFSIWGLVRSRAVTGSGRPARIVAIIGLVVGGLALIGTLLLPVGH